MVRVTKPVIERRQEIIATARRMFEENGYDNTQVADISKEMNVAAGTVYHYFKSKTEMLYAVIDELVDENFQMKHQLFIETQGSAFDQLKLFFDAFENGEFSNNWIDSLTDDPAISQYYLAKMSNSSESILMSLIERGNTDGSWKCEYPTETAVFILHGLFGVMTIEHESKDPPQEKGRRIKEYANIIYRVLDTTHDSS